MSEPRTDVPSHRSFADRVGGLAIAAMCRLPARVQVLLSGGKPIVLDGQTLAPDLQLVLSVEKKRQLTVMSTPALLRVEQRKSARLVAGTKARVGSVRDLDIQGAEGPLRARHYAPANGAGAPLLVFLHGGGFVFGDLDTHDSPCRVLCKHGGMHVLAVEYRLAPEHHFPAAVDDAVAALRWAQSHAAELGADPTRVGIGGDSAGANLSAAVSLLTAKDAPPACQVLIYPAVDRTRPYASLELFAEGFFLTRASIDWFHRQYTGILEGSHRAFDKDPRLGPLHADSHAGLAPALVVTAGFDPLRDEGEAYAATLRAAGTQTVLRRFESLIHGFFNMVGVSPVCRDAVIEIAGATRALFAVSPARARAPSASSSTDGRPVNPGAPS